MRRKQKYKRIVEPDLKYNSVVITKLIKTIMLDGKLSVSEGVVYGAMSKVEELSKSSPIEIFDLAIRNISPVLEIKSKRVGGANYQVPREVRGERKLALALRWLIQAARAKKGDSMANRLADEIMLASKNEGSAIKKREDTQRMAEANKAFAHFSW
ncbi:30S ribosomal protein S7 [Candidatus Azambacteria bacterium]|nr:30S ribosomal protein S7 [Candidatus Azambacteria bacterium]